jgi:hypothetical protein
VRFYKIQIEGGPTWDSTGDANALNVEFDIPIRGYALPVSGAFLRVWGIDLSTLLGAKTLNKKNIKIYGGMDKGLPLANPVQQGLLAEGSIYPAFGNWVGLDMTLDMALTPKLGIDDQAGAANVVHSAPANQPMGTSIQNALNAAFPGYTTNVNVSQNLVLNYKDTGFFQTLQQYAGYLGDISKSIIGGSSYHGVDIAVSGTQINVFDGTGAATNAPTINFQDLVGQPIWLNAIEIQFKTVLRGDLSIGQTITLPPALATLGNISALAASGGAPPSNQLQGSFVVTQIRHVGNFRQPDWASWATVVNAKSTSG